ncbi:hypothetical protein QBC32DRAFT_270038 [Pseudoneurospora amorphoporcata]|uniref:Uncharacterized protein n=1 Tax=Pseudoneurospora amorphoporcata TaxID=241081 RepID=A0AAN6NMY4_9PEZI|nr:hypothetical protein QBC32DRAFT_270038 [Pseudoneurospora amorphoporcata]
METSTTSQPGQSEEPPYRSYEELERLPGGVRLSREIDRLFWEFKGAFPSAISVMANRRGAKGHLEPFFQPADAADDQNPENNDPENTSTTTSTTTSTGTYHPIALLPMTEPPASFISVSCTDLDTWESNWVEWHEWHSEEKGEFVTYGDLDDDVRPWAKEPRNEEDPENWEEDSDTEFLIKCCGEERPLRTAGRRLKVTPRGGKGFVTIGDYVCAVHTWLMSMRDEVLEARGVRQYDQCDASAFEWMVDFYPGEPKHWLEEKSEWVDSHCPPSQASIDAANAMMRSLGGSGNVVDVSVIHSDSGGEGQEERTEGQEEQETEGQEEQETEGEGKGKKRKGQEDVEEIQQYPKGIAQPRNV